MDTFQAILARRSIRRFLQKPIAREDLTDIAESARLAPTGSNSQPLRFVVVSDTALCEKIFPHTHWAALANAAGPTESTQPVAYIAILVDLSVRRQADTDAGAAGMSMLLCAQSRGIASCWLGAIDRGDILSLLSVDAERFALHSLVAFGYPAMQSRAVDAQDGQTAYYLESPDSLCVPKRLARETIQWREGGTQWK